MRTYLKLAKKGIEIGNRKVHDYAQADNPHSNFERAAVISSWFNNPVHAGFAYIIGIKLARLAELLNGKEPKNEPIEDTFIDGSNYFLLFGAKVLDDMENGK